MFPSQYARQGWNVYDVRLQMGAVVGRRESSVDFQGRRTPRVPSNTVTCPLSIDLLIIAFLNYYVI